MPDCPPSRIRPGRTAHPAKTLPVYHNLPSCREPGCCSRAAVWRICVVSGRPAAPPVGSGRHVFFLARAVFYLQASDRNPNPIHMRRHLCCSGSCSTNHTPHPNMGGAGPETNIETHDTSHAQLGPGRREIGRAYTPPPATQPGRPFRGNFSGCRKQPQAPAVGRQRPPTP